MSGQSKTLFLPDTTAKWPWKRMVNTKYEEVKAESDAWFRSFKVFTPESKKAFDKCDFALLAALAYPRASKEHLRTGCDLLTLYFVIDEYTDVESEGTVRSMVEPVIDALKNPHKPRPEGEIILGEIARQFWELAIKTASPASQRHMVDNFIAYLESVVTQAGDRDNDKYHSIASYFPMRRQNVGTGPAFVPLELGFDLPDEVFFHPVIVGLATHATDLIILDGDILSYNKEQAVGDDRHNIVTLAMLEFNMDLDGAIGWCAKYHAEVEAKFLDLLKCVPSWGPDMDSQVQQYLDGIANWVRANVCWSFEGGRYFGNKGPEIQKTQRVPLLAKIAPPRLDESLRRENVAVPLVEALEATS